MNNKVLGAIVVGLAVILIIFMATRDRTNVNVDVTPEPVVSTPNEPENPNTNGTPTGGTSGGTATAGTSYTLAQIATHNSAASCWAAVNGNVYDLTSWISRHPGGSDAIKFLCGKDGTAAFSAQHGGQANPASMLASFKIGTVAR